MVFVPNGALYTLRHAGGADWSLQTADGEAITSMGPTQVVHRLIIVRLPASAAKHSPHSGGCSSNNSEHAFAITEVVGAYTRMFWPGSRANHRGLEDWGQAGLSRSGVHID